MLRCHIRKAQVIVIPNKECKTERGPKDPGFDCCIALGLRQLWEVGKGNVQRALKALATHTPGSLDKRSIECQIYALKSLTMS